MLFGELMIDFEYDPTAPDFQRNPFSLFKTLRDDHPVYYNERLRFWALSRYDDVLTAAAQWKLFGNSVSLYPASETEPTELMPRWMMDFGLFYMDPPRHDRLRALVSRAFTPTRTAALEPVVRELARDLLRKAADRGRCEIVHDFAAPLATQVIGALLGVPAEDRWQFRLWAEKIEQRDPSISVEVAEQEQIETVDAIREYMSALVEERRERPQDDLLSALIAAEIEGDRLDDDQIVNMGYQLMIAGNDTTAAMISNGALRLAENPDERRLLIDAPELMPNAVEEMTRYDSPTVQSPPRVTTREVELHGRRIPKGEPVVLIWMAANHDERRYPDPMRFDIRRKLGRHMGFGHGLHFCIGANLARLEGRVAFEELLRAMPDYSIEGEALRWASVWLRPIGSLPIAFDAKYALAALDA
jgi:cytochrome P450